MKGTSSVLKVYLLPWVWPCLDSEVDHIVSQHEYRDKNPSFQILLCMLCSFEGTYLFVQASNLSKLQQASSQSVEKESLAQFHSEALQHATCKQGQSHWTSSML